MVAPGESLADVIEVPVQDRDVAPLDLMETSEVQPLAGTTLPVAPVAVPAAAVATLPPLQPMASTVAPLTPQQPVTAPVVPVIPMQPATAATAAEPAQRKASNISVLRFLLLSLPWILVPILGLCVFLLVNHIAHERHINHIAHGHNGDESVNRTISAPLPHSPRMAPTRSLPVPGPFGGTESEKLSDIWVHSRRPSNRLEIPGERSVPKASPRSSRSLRAHAKPSFVTDHYTASQSSSAYKLSSSLPAAKAKATPCGSEGCNFKAWNTDIPGYCCRRCASNPGEHGPLCCQEPMDTCSLAQELAQDY